MTTPSVPAGPSRALLTGPLRALGTVLACTLALVGCASGSEPVPSRPVGSSTGQRLGPATAPTWTPTDVADCLPDGTTAVLAGSTDDPTVVAFAGSGPQAVLLAPQNQGDECQWADELGRLVDEGYLVATFAWADDGEVSFRSALAVLQSQGAQRTAFVGASKGGTYAAALAADLGAVGLVAVSAPATFDGMDAASAATAYDGPLLVVASADDTDVPADETREIARTDDPAGFVQLEGSAHGVAILDGPHAGQLRDLVDETLTQAFAR
ncbi:alpha/beta hydrolase family protein [Cellulomonas soli]|uniref:Alpha/beta hydrolase n=1 Tax=Cellulomonas soli TaxID=931535 RepID=A0A512P868_9CELL|nr:hypothetical protein [Cellulomonas soli]NYI57620.1 pimeloyl-ACP methyl ester carboxylesterase [Cellulomonas soli]GEP67397.1 hypothetical protein CSO01_01120 [Cellulomonas soli]